MSSLAAATPQFEATATAATVPEAGACPATQVIVLSRDPALLEVLQDVIANDALAFISDEAALARHLLTGRAGVVLLDSEALGANLAELASKLHSQLPDLALIATGTTADEPALASLLTTGVIHRFLHKPVSAQRVKLFVDAGWRRYESAVSGTWPALPQLPEPEAANSAPIGLAPAAAVLLAVAVAGLSWLSIRLSEPRHPSPGASLTGMQRPFLHTATPLPRVHLWVPPAPPALNAANLDLTLPLAPDAQLHKPISALLLNKTHFVDPVYPLSARGHDDNGGRVELEFTVRADGSVADVDVTHATPPGIYEAAAVDAVRQWRYEPIQRDGHAVDQRVYLELRFAYHADDQP